MDPTVAVNCRHRLTPPCGPSARRLLRQSGGEEAEVAADEDILPSLPCPAPLVNVGRPLVRVPTRKLCLFDG